jgi:signal transduction histidine kinase/CheY-like chemotaxis protein
VSSPTPIDSFPALILAPRGRDATVAESLIGAAGVASRRCRDLPDLVACLSDDIAFVMVTEEAIRNADLKPLAQWIANQPAWSDMPFVLVTDHGGGPERNPIAGRWLETLGNVSFIERPFHPTTLQSVARTAIAGRRRQLETRSLLADLSTARDELEQRVRERTSELQQAHDELIAQTAERERTEEQLRHMQKIESIGALTGGVAHDFNNLLTAVLGNLEMLKKRLPHDDSIDQLLDGAMQGAQRGAALTQRLLAFARRQALDPRPVDLTALVRGMNDLLRRTIGTTIEVKLDLPAALPAAHVDANQIELALLNLAVNARDAMPEGGTLTISIDVVDSGTAHDLAPGRYIRLCVSDTGSGMDSDTLARAIEPFFSTKEIGKGTGLGLSMIHGLAQQLHGTLRLFSEPGKGTRAELWLPVSSAQPAAAVAEPEPQQPEEKKKSATLLYVDDDFLIGMSTTTLLEDLGHTVIKANSGAKALEVLEAGTAVDLMITDYAMPGMTGMQLAEAARRLRPSLPILLATGYADLPEAGAIDLPRLSKPYQQHQLAQHIAALLG